VLALGIVAAVGASLLYNTSIALQALEAREVPGEHSLRVSLIGRLVRNRRWLGATALGLVGWPLEIAALLLAPLTVVQPCIASGLILLLWLGATRLGETPGRREVVAVAAIILGVAGVAWAAPERSTDHAGAAAIAVALVVVAVPVLLPYALRQRANAAGLPRGTDGIGLLMVLGAGCGYAWTAIASKLLTDELAAGALLVALAWLATAAASEGLALLNEMSALQRRAATHVAPIMFAVQVIVPVLLAPLIFGESWGDTPLGGAALVAFMALTVAGTALLAGSRAVGAVMSAAHSSD
jgi:drug/metabolite transporter (DMT)-like permease